VTRQHWDVEAPGKGIAHQAMKENESGPRTGLQVAHAGAVNFSKALFYLGLGQGRKFLGDFRWHDGFFGCTDNFLARAGVYVCDIASVASE
jgi:hypothetical protein